MCWKLMVPNSVLIFILSFDATPPLESESYDSCPYLQKISFQIHFNISLHLMQHPYISSQFPVSFPTNSVA